MWWTYDIQARAPVSNSARSWQSLAEAQEFCRLNPTHVVSDNASYTGTSETVPLFWKGLYWQPSSPPGPGDALSAASLVTDPSAAASPAGNIAGHSRTAPAVGPPAATSLVDSHAGPSRTAPAQGGTLEQ